MGETTKLETRHRKDIADRNAMLCIKINAYLICFLAAHTSAIYLKRDKNCYCCRIVNAIYTSRLHLL